MDRLYFRNHSNQGVSVTCSSSIFKSWVCCSYGFYIHGCYGCFIDTVFYTPVAYIYEIEAPLAFVNING